MSNITFKNTTSSIFLAIILTAGTFAGILPSSFIIEVNADQCGEDVKACFQQFLNDNQLRLLDSALFDGIEVTIAGNTIILHSFEDICFALQGLTFPQLEEALIEITVEAGLGIPIDIEPLLFACIAEALGIPIIT